MYSIQYILKRSIYILLNPRKTYYEYIYRNLYRLKKIEQVKLRDECYRIYSSQFKHYLEIQKFDDKEARGEKEYLQKWSVLCSRVEPYSYRFFSHYCGYNPNIVPEDIGRIYIEEILNPSIYRHVYTDKIFFQK